MAFRPIKLALWLVYTFFGASQCPLFAQSAPINQNTSNLWNSIESLLGQPEEGTRRYFTVDKVPADTLLAKAEAYIVSYKNDSAILISNLVFHKLKQKNQLESPLGLKVQLVLARALEHNDADSVSLRLLLHVKERCQKKGPWDTYVKSCLALALLEENRHRPVQCMEYLNHAKSAIDRHKLKTFYPAYAMRACSYYRILVNNQDSAVYYAKEVLRTAPVHNMILEEAWGHLLLASLLYHHKPTQWLEQLHAAAKLFIKIQDYTGLSYTFGGISNSYAEEGDMYKALIFNDSTIFAAQKSITQGNKWNPAFPEAFRFRAELLRHLGAHDSAWHYLHKGYQVELNFIQAKENAKILEIDARYLNERKTQQIQEQTEAIQVEKRVTKLLLLIFGITLLFAVGLVFGLIKYIKERRILAEKNKLIQHQSEQLQALDAAKSRFFANVSHELRTPLTLLTSPIQTLLKENQLTEKQTQLLQMAERSGKLLHQLINEILDLRKLEMGKMALAPESTELRSWFQAYFAQFESLAKQKQLDYQVCLDISEQTIVDLDREKCRQLLFNLLSNAFKFTPPGGRIEAQVLVVEQQLQLQVTNSGPGIHPEDLPHVFDRYFQSKRPDKPAEGGTGIGLALCREYVQLFGGTISVESTPGTNTTFQVRFPLQQSAIEAEDLTQLASITHHTPPEAAVPNPLSEALSPKSAATQTTILLVEDNPDLRDYIRLVLQDKYQVITAEHGQAAWSMLDKNSTDQTCTPPDLILSDLMMPVMDGYQLLEKLKSDDATRHIPVVMLSARAEAQDKLQALRIGVDDYLTKPFNEEELLVRIENLLNNQASRRLATTDDAPTSETTAPLLSQPDREWLASFEVYVQKHFSSNTLSVSSLAYTFAMSESTLLRQLKRLTGLSPLQYIQEVRLNEARRLLENRSYNTIAQVASKVGYDDARSFTRSFKQRYGKLPSDVLHN